MKVKKAGARASPSCCLGQLFLNKSTISSTEPFHFICSLLLHTHRFVSTLLIKLLLLPLIHRSGASLVATRQIKSINITSIYTRLIPSDKLLTWPKDHNLVLVAHQQKRRILGGHFHVGKLYPADAGDGN